MNTLLGWSLSFTIFLFGISIDDKQTSEERPPVRQVSRTTTTVRQVSRTTTRADSVATTPSVAHTPEITFKHGDISWLPELALKAGWDPKNIPRLGQIILRESGGCPNRRGGDVVDANCAILRVSEWNHRSDTGLLQINGVNYDTSRNKWAAVCAQAIACSQEILFDPLANLRAGLVLFKIAGWGPWDPCQWGPKFAKRCKKSKP